MVESDYVIQINYIKQTMNSDRETVKLMNKFKNLFLENNTLDKTLAKIIENRNTKILEFKKCIKIRKLEAFWLNENKIPSVQQENKSNYNFVIIKWGHINSGISLQTNRIRKTMSRRKPKCTMILMLYKGGN